MALALDSVAPPAGPRAPPARAEGRSGRLRREPAPHRPGAQHVRTDMSLTTCSRRRTPRPRDVIRSMSARTCPSRHTSSRSRTPRPRDVTRSMSARTCPSRHTCSRRRAPRPRDVTRSMSARTCPSRHARVAAHPGPVTSPAACPHGHVPHDLLASPHTQAPRRHPQPVRTDMSLTTYMLASPRTQAPRRHPQHVRTDMSLTTYILASPRTQAPRRHPQHVRTDMSLTTYMLASPRTQAPRRHPQHVRTDMSLTTCSRRRAPRPRDVTRSMSARTPGRPPRHCAYRGAINVSQETCPSSDSAPRGPAAVRLSAQATVSSFSVNLGARGPAGGATESSARDIVGTTPDTTASATCLSVAPPAGHRAAPGYAGA
jgi:hypothetical protein